MRILHVIECFAPKYGGPVTALKALISAQADEGHKITICTTNRDYPKGTTRQAGKEVFYNESLEIHYFPTQFPPLRFSIQLALFLRKRMSDFDIVHIHGLYRFPSTYAAHCARKKNVPHIICPHGALDPYLHNRSAQSLTLKRVYRQFFDLPNLRGASAIQYTSHEERERAEHLQLKTPSFVLRHGIDESRYKHLPEKGHFRHLLGVGNAPLVLFLGRLHSVKGLNLLIPAFDRLRNTYPQAHLAIVGPDSNGYGKKVREWVRQRNLEKHAHFVGYLEEAEVREALTDASILVLPSYTESFGMTVIESMACATPVVISDKVHIHREVENAGAGLVTDGSVECTATALEKLMANPEKSREMGQAGRKTAMAQYTWNAVMDTLMAEYRTVIDGEPDTAHTSEAADRSRT